MKLRVPYRARSSLAIVVACFAPACSSGAKSDTVANASPDAATPGPGVGCFQAGADSYAAGLHKLGVQGRYRFELVSSLPAPPALNDNTFVVQVTDADGNPVAGELAVALEMPEHGHPSPKQPVITFDGATQTFKLEPMRLFMVGLWRLTFRFQSAALAGAAAVDADWAVFEFCID